MNAISSVSTASCDTLAQAHKKQPAGDGRSTLGLVEVFLKDPLRVDQLIREPARETDLVPRLLAIALSGFTIFGVAATAILSASGTALPWVPRARWSDGSALWLILAYDVGLIAACGVCLPSFYFYGLLAGVRTSMLQVTLYAVKGLAATSVVLVGILPVYVAVALGLVVFGAPRQLLEQALYVGLALPFLAGLWGIRSITTGFMDLADTLPEERRPARGCFLRRLIVSWGACYTAVTPVMIYTLWRHLAA